MDSSVKPIGPITGFSRHYYRYELGYDGKLLQRLISHSTLDLPPEQEIKRCGASMRLVTNPDPNERILHYCGRNMFTDEPMFGGVFEGTRYNDWVELRGEKAYWDSGYQIYYSGNEQLIAYKAWGGDYTNPLDGKAKPYVNVGTIGHVDYAGYRQEVLSPLQQAIRDINNRY